MCVVLCATHAYQPHQMMWSLARAAILFLSVLAVVAASAGADHHKRRKPTLIGDTEVNYRRSSVVSGNSVSPTSAEDEDDAELLPMIPSDVATKTSTATAHRKKVYYNNYNKKSRNIKKYSRFLKKKTHRLKNKLKKSDKEQKEKKLPLTKGSGTADDDVRRLWGVPDSEAVVGEVFRLVIGDQAFSGPVLEYEVSPLPPWLQYVASPPSVVGVPPPSALSAPLYLSVTARGARGSARDTWALTVRRRQAAPACSPAPHELTVVLTVNQAAVRPRQLVHAVSALAELTGLDDRELRVTSGPPVDPLLSPHAVEAARLMPPHTPGEALEAGEDWTYVKSNGGCSGPRVGSIQRLQEAGDGLADKLGLPVMGWSLAADASSTSTRRGHRVPRSPQQGGGEIASTDYDYNYDYDYDNLEYDEYDPDAPYDTYDEGDYDQPEERVVPSLATPVYPGPAGDAHPPTHTYQLPPILRPVPVSTPLYVPIKPTRVVIQPSPTASSTPLQPTALPTTTPTTGTTTPPPPVHHHTVLVEPTRLIDESSTMSPTTTEPLPPTTSTSGSGGSGDGSEVTDHLVRNFPPKVLRRIDKLAWVGGFVYRLKVPNDTFVDTEDGYTRSLRLVLTNGDGTQLGTKSWIQLDPVTQEIYALPLEDLMGYHTFLLEAIDSGGRSVTESVKIHVEQPKEARNYNHRYSATLRIAKKYEYEFMYALDWQIRVVQKIAGLFDNSSASLNIRSISDNPTRVVWTNTSLVDSRSNTCPYGDLEDMNTVLFGAPHSATHHPTRAVEDAFRPEFHLKRIHVHYLEHCEDYTRRTTTTTAESPEAPHVPPHNVPPQFINQIDFINTTAGSVYRWQVPKDACYDSEDGKARNLRLRLLTADLKRIEPGYSWLQFDSNNQEFYGLPLGADVGEVEYSLECLDSLGAVAVDALTVVVAPNPLLVRGAAPQPALFSVTINQPYQDLRDKIRLVHRLGTAFGDADGQLISVTSLGPTSDGSGVEVTWYNKSLSPPPPPPADGGPSLCPSDVIQELHDRMYTPEDSIRAQFADHFLPEFVISDGNILPEGACLSYDTPGHNLPPDLGKEDAYGFEDIGGAPGGSAASSPPEDYLLTFLVPSVLMAAMLVLAAVAACCLYRHRRRYAKMSLTTAADHEATTFVTTGIPVILAEELDDHPGSMGCRVPLAKTPVIMKEEKPPLPPYRQSPPLSGPPRPHHQQQQQQQQQHQQPYQQPPPPFTNGRSNSPRSNRSNSGQQAQPPAYRKPTYIPP